MEMEIDDALTSLKQQKSNAIEILHAAFEEKYKKLMNVVSSKYDFLSNNSFNNQYSGCSAVTQGDILNQKEMFCKRLTTALKEYKANQYCPNKLATYITLISGLRRDAYQLMKIVASSSEKLETTKAEISELEEQIKLLDQIKKNLRIDSTKVTAEQEAEKINRKFKEYKEQLKTVLNILYPGDETIVDILKILCDNFFNIGQRVYTDILPKWIPYINMLEKASIIRFNPYNKNQIRLNNLCD